MQASTSEAHPSPQASEVQQNLTANHRLVQFSNGQAPLSMTGPSTNQPVPLQASYSTGYSMPNSTLPSNASNNHLIRTPQTPRQQQNVHGVIRAPGHPNNLDPRMQPMIFQQHHMRLISRPNQSPTNTIMPQRMASRPPITQVQHPIIISNSQRFPHFQQNNSAHNQHQHQPANGYLQNYPVDAAFNQGYIMGQFSPEYSQQGYPECPPQHQLYSQDYQQVMSQNYPPAYEQQPRFQHPYTSQTATSVQQKNRSPPKKSARVPKPGGQKAGGGRKKKSPLPPPSTGEEHYSGKPSTSHVPEIQTPVEHTYESGQIRMFSAPPVRLPNTSSLQSNSILSQDASSNFAHNHQISLTNEDLEWEDGMEVIKYHAENPDRREPRPSPVNPSSSTSNGYQDRTTSISEETRQQEALIHQQNLKTQNNNTGEIQPPPLRRPMPNPLAGKVQSKKLITSTTMYLPASIYSPITLQSPPNPQNDKTSSSVSQNISNSPSVNSAQVNENMTKNTMHARDDNLEHRSYSANRLNSDPQPFSIPPNANLDTTSMPNSVAASRLQMGPGPSTSRIYQDLLDPSTSSQYGTSSSEQVNNESNSAPQNSEHQFSGHLSSGYESENGTQSQAFKSADTLETSNQEAWGHNFRGEQHADEIADNIRNGNNNNNNRMGEGFNGSNHQKNGPHVLPNHENDTGETEVVRDDTHTAPILPRNNYLSSHTLSDNGAYINKPKHGIGKNIANYLNLPSYSDDENDDSDDGNPPLQATNQKRRSPSRTSTSSNQDGEEPENEINDATEEESSYQGEVENETIAPENVEINAADNLSPKNAITGNNKACLFSGNSETYNNNLNEENVILQVSPETSSNLQNDDEAEVADFHKLSDEEKGDEMREAKPSDASDIEDGEIASSDSENLNNDVEDKSPVVAEEPSYHTADVLLPSGENVVAEIEDGEIDTSEEAEMDGVVQGTSNQIIDVLMPSVDEIVNIERASQSYNSSPKFAELDEDIIVNDIVIANVELEHANRESAVEKTKNCTDRSTANSIVDDNTTETQRDSYRLFEGTTNQIEPDSTEESVTNRHKTILDEHDLPDESAVFAVSEPPLLLKSSSNAPNIEETYDMAYDRPSTGNFLSLNVAADNDVIMGNLGNHFTNEAVLKSTENFLKEATIETTLPVEVMDTSDHDDLTAEFSSQQSPSATVELADHESPIQHQTITNADKASTDMLLNPSTYAEFPANIHSDNKNNMDKSHREAEEFQNVSSLAPPSIDFPLTEIRDFTLHVTTQLNDLLVYYQSQATTEPPRRMRFFGQQITARASNPQQRQLIATLPAVLAAIERAQTSLLRMSSEVPRRLNIFDQLKEFLPNTLEHSVAQWESTIIELLGNVATSSTYQYIQKMLEFVQALSGCVETLISKRTTLQQKAEANFLFHQIFKQLQELLAETPKTLNKPLNLSLNEISTFVRALISKAFESVFILRLKAVLSTLSFEQQRELGDLITPILTSIIVSNDFNAGINVEELLNTYDTPTQEALTQLLRSTPFQRQSVMGHIKQLIRKLEQCRSTSLDPLTKIFEEMISLNKTPGLLSKPCDVFENEWLKKLTKAEMNRFGNGNSINLKNLFRLFTRERAPQHREAFTTMISSETVGPFKNLPTEFEHRDVLMDKVMAIIDTALRNAEIDSKIEFCLQHPYYAEIKGTILDSLKNRKGHGLLFLTNIFNLNSDQTLGEYLEEEKLYFHELHHRVIGLFIQIKTRRAYADMPEIPKNKQHVHPDDHLLFDMLESICVQRDIARNFGELCSDSLFSVITGAIIVNSVPGIQIEDVVTELAEKCLETGLQIRTEKYADVLFKRVKLSLDAHLQSVIEDVKNRVVGAGVPRVISHDISATQTGIHQLRSLLLEIFVTFYDPKALNSANKWMRKNKTSLKEFLVKIDSEFQLMVSLASDGDHSLQALTVKDISKAFEAFIIEIVSTKNNFYTTIQNLMEIFNIKSYSLIMYIIFYLWNITGNDKMMTKRMTFIEDIVHEPLLLEFFGVMRSKAKAHGHVNESNLFEALSKLFQHDFLLHSSIKFQE